MLEDLTNKINERKNEKRPYEDLLGKIEDNLATFSLFDKAQGYYLLIKEYFNIDKERTLILIDNGINAIIECFDKRILYRNDFSLFCDILTDILATKIRITKRFELFDEYKKYKRYYDEKPDKLFYLCIEIYNSSKDIKWLVLTLDYTNESTLKMSFEYYFSLGVRCEEFLDRFTTIGELNGAKYYYGIFVDYKKCLIEKIIEFIVSKKNNYEDLNVIYVNAIITDKKNIYCEVVDQMKRVLPCIESSFNYYLMLADKNRDGDTVYKDTPRDHAINIQLIEYFMHCKLYKKVLSCNASLDTRMYCLLKLDMTEEASTIYEKYLQEKYSVLKENGKTDTISLVNIFTLHLKLKDNIGCLNVIQTINQPYIFHKCLKKAYKKGNLVVMKEAIGIGIRKYGTSDISLIKILTSFLHIKELKIEIEERVMMLLEILKGIEIQNMFERDKRWFYDVVYNNCIDSINIKLEDFWSLVLFCLLLKDIDNDIIYMCLSAICNNIRNKKKVNMSPLIYTNKINSLADQLKETIINGSCTDEIAAILLELYIKSTRRITKIDLLFYSILDTQKARELINCKSLNNKQLLQAVNTNTSSLMFRLDLIREAQKRKVLDKKTVSKIIASVALLGSHELYELLTKINLSEYYNDFIENIIMKQIELLSLVRNKNLMKKYEEILIRNNEKKN